MAPKPPIMHNMQPISLVGAQGAPAASTGSAAPTSGDGAGFAALLGGTALTPPGVATAGTGVQAGGQASAQAGPVLSMLIGQPLTDAAAMSGTVQAAAPQNAVPQTVSADAGTTTPAGTAETEAVSPAAPEATLPDMPIAAAPQTAEGAATPPAAAPGKPGKPKLAETTDAPMPAKVLPADMQAQAAAQNAAKTNDDAAVPAAPVVVSRPNAETETARRDTKPAKAEDAPILAAVAPVQPMVATVVAAAGVSTPAAASDGKSADKAPKATAAVAPSLAVRTGDGEPAAVEPGTKQDDTVGKSFEKLVSSTKVEGTDAAPNDKTASAQRDAATPRDFSAALDLARAPNGPDAPRPADMKTAAQPVPAQPQDQVVRASSLGQDMGIALSRHANDKGDQVVTLRLDPGHLGKIEVRLAMDDKGMMTARISADHHHTLDLIRRDTDTLVRTLNDAGVRTDAQGFRFDGGGAFSGGQQNAAWGGQQGSGQGRHTPFHSAGTASDDINDPLLASQMQSLGIASGRVDLLA
ncbi:MAG: hypothetical protein CMN72_02580 [Sphingomonas sp.]|nr:hypothetical protein [Sphingomonas sp.]